MKKRLARTLLKMARRLDPPSSPRFNINVGNAGQSVGEMQRRAYRDASATLAKLSGF